MSPLSLISLSNLSGPDIAFVALCGAGLTALYVTYRQCVAEESLQVKKSRLDEAESPALIRDMENLPEITNRLKWNHFLDELKAEEEAHVKSNPQN